MSGDGDIIGGIHSWGRGGPGTSWAWETWGWDGDEGAKVCE